MAFLRVVLTKSGSVRETRDAPHERLCPRSANWADGITIGG